MITLILVSGVNDDDVDEDDGNSDDNVDNYDNTDDNDYHDDDNIKKTHLDKVV